MGAMAPIDEARNRVDTHPRNGLVPLGIAGDLLDGGLLSRDFGVAAHASGDGRQSHIRVRALVLVAEVAGQPEADVLPVAEGYGLRHIYRKFVFRTLVLLRAQDRDRSNATTENGQHKNGAEYFLALSHQRR